MTQYQRAATDADVFVQAVEFVETAEALLQPGWAGGKHHAGAHPPQGEDARENDQGATNVPKAGVGGENFRKGKNAPEPERNQGEKKERPFHGDLLFCD